MGRILSLDNPVLIFKILTGVKHPIPAEEEANDVPEISVSER